MIAHPARRNFRLNVLDGVAWSTSMAFISQGAILPLFVARYTSASWVLGLLPAIAYLGTAVLQLVGVAYTARQPDLWATLKLQIAAPRLALVALCLAPALPSQWALGCFFAAYALFCAAAGFNAPVWFEFIGYLIEPAARGLFFGYRSAYGGLMSLAAAGAASWVLASFPGALGFELCFLLALAFNLLSFWCVVSTRHDFAPIEVKRQQPPGFWRAAGELLSARPLLLRYVLARVPVVLTMAAGGFYVVHGKQAFGLGEATSSLLAIAFLYLPALGGVSLGRLTDRHGTRRLQVSAALLAGLGSLALILAPAVMVYAAGLVLIGFATMAYSIADNHWLLAIAPERTGLSLSLFNLLTLPVAVASSLGAGVVADHFGMRTLFAIAAVGWAVGAAAIARLPTPA